MVSDATRFVTRFNNRVSTTGNIADLIKDCEKNNDGDINIQEIQKLLSVSEENRFPRPRKPTPLMLSPSTPRIPSGQQAQTSRPTMLASSWSASWPSQTPARTAASAAA